MELFTGVCILYKESVFDVILQDLISFKIYTSFFFKFIEIQQLSHKIRTCQYGFNTVRVLAISIKMGLVSKSYSHTLRSLQLSSVCSNSPCYWLTVIQSLPCTPEADPLVQTSCPEPGIPHQVLDLEYTTYTKHITCFTQFQKIDPTFIF